MAADSGLSTGACAYRQIESSRLKGDDGRIHRQTCRQTKEKMEADREAGARADMDRQTDRQDEQTD